MAKSERTKKQGRDYLTTTRTPSPPISLPDGRQLVTLRDAGDYITKLPKAKHEAPEWQAAMEALILVATQGGPTMFARIGIMQALTATMFASSIWTASPTIGENGNSRGTNDHLDYLLGSSWVICWLVAGLPPYPDFVPCFAARLANSRNVFAIASSPFPGRDSSFARSCKRLDISKC